MRHLPLVKACVCGESHVANLKLAFVVVHIARASWLLHLLPNICTSPMQHVDRITRFELQDRVAQRLDVKKSSTGGCLVTCFQDKEEDFSA